MYCTFQKAKNKGADQLHGYREAELQLCFANAKSWFSHNEAHLSVQNA